MRQGGREGAGQHEGKTAVAHAAPRHGIAPGVEVARRGQGIFHAAFGLENELPARPGWPDAGTRRHEHAVMPAGAIGAGDALRRIAGVDELRQQRPRAAGHAGSQAHVTQPGEPFGAIARQQRRRDRPGLRPAVAVGELDQRTPAVPIGGPAHRRHMQGCRQPNRGLQSAFCIAWRVPHTIVIKPEAPILGADFAGGFAAPPSAARAGLASRLGGLG